MEYSCQYNEHHLANKKCSEFVVTNIRMGATWLGSSSVRKDHMNQLC